MTLPCRFIINAFICVRFLHLLHNVAGDRPCSNNICNCTLGETNQNNISCVETEREYELHPQDGYYNNLIHPDWGAIDGQLLRKSPTNYSDGVYEPASPERPNPLDISDVAHKGGSGLKSLRNRTALLVFFGQQVVEEIMDSQRPGCPREFFNIPIPKGHVRYDPEGEGGKELPLLRTRFDARTGYSPNNPRQQLNEITPFLDGGLMYGTAKAWTDTLREFKGGRLLAEDLTKPLSDSIPVRNDIRLPMPNPPSPKDHVLRPVTRFYRIGNPRGNENPFLLAFGVMWFRWHNYLCERLSATNPDWSDERLFNEARKLVIAQHQKIVMYDWLPAWLQRKENSDLFPIPAYKGYNPHVHPGVSQEMQTAALRYGHTLVVSVVITRKLESGQCSRTTMPIRVGGGHQATLEGIRLCQSYWKSQEAISEGPGLDALYLGMAHTLAEKEDHIIVDDLRGDLFGPLEFSRRDLGAINIQRGRDHGIPGYNAVRKAYGLDPIYSWNDINNISAYDTTLTDIFKQLQKMYNNDSVPDNLDLFTGGLLETTPDGPGDLFRNIMLEQFERIRDGDRFWFENRENGLFTDEDLQFIQDTDLGDIISLTTGITRSELPVNVFFCDGNSATCDCLAPGNASLDKYENCEPGLQTYDYFSGSEASFALTLVALGLCVPITIGVMILMAKSKEKTMQQAKRRSPRKLDGDPNKFTATEWVGATSGERNVMIELKRDRKKIVVMDLVGKTLRLIDLRHSDKVRIRMSEDRPMDLMSIRVQGEIDLVLRFDSSGTRDSAVRNLESFLQDIGVNREKISFSSATIIKEAETYDDRKLLLDKFFRIVCLQAFKKNMRDMNLGELDGETINKIRNIKLTRTEFAESLGMEPNSMFVRNMFLLVDTTKDGFVSFEEFMTMFMTLASGTADEKAQLLFNMYDIKRKGELTRDQFSKMLKSMMDLADASVDQARVDQLLNSMFEQAGISGKNKMTFDDFKKIFASDDHREILNKATMGLDVEGGQIDSPSRGLTNRQTVLRRYKSGTRTSDVNRTSKVNIVTKKTKPPMSKLGQQYYEFQRYIENYRLQIFWGSLFSLITAGIFIERAYFYSVLREHSGLRRLAGFGVSVTRGAASAQMFTYAFLLITMSRNTLTFFRETFLHRFIPFDSFHAMHKYVAILALLMTAMHIVGHAINLYHICTQASMDLNCYFREYFRATHVLASFHYWAFGTITGITGIILTVIIIVMYVFATEYARRHVFNAFWFTHNFYIVLYLFLVLHGLGRLVQDPIWGYYFIGPLVIFVIDKFISISRNKVEITVKTAKMLPSGVTFLEFKRPLNFDYKSGQWVRVACLKLGKSEYHPFTLTSSPHEETLTLHIRAVGPWTTNLRRVYDPNVSLKMPKLYLDGPFGEGHQDWYRYPVAVLVGGGIGVTPFASILKDLVHKSRMKVKFPCRKVYFLWVTRTQKSFEWLTDMIREVENGDINNLVSVHIFITQFQQKFDLRTTMLYICEQHFQRVAGQSLFTGLRAITHFGRPVFQDFLYSLTIEHEGVPNIGVFSCGPPPMTHSMESACTTLNKLDGPTYVHHFENF
ncbi:dual oxidase 2-like [Gigantopelta aegis]|uniref:dual oxidase 2-like n=1 Tax=Gigantopelta aegis TaxID=1735272 RepID=UPI001B88D027|nr:dual oxidase 2-like [Gigantopelta aegis]